MKSAYIYVRVSTDEQMRKGYSLIEQEERLLRHCEINGIQVKGIFREDYSAKDFNRPAWKKLLQFIKKNNSRGTPDNILFLKWDRFSRNIEYAYQMLRLLKELNVQAMAIDQPIDIEVPESIVMLAVYLSIPEAENSRRGINTSEGIRRAQKLGRYPSKAPIGYENITSSDGKKYIIPKQPEANHIKWAFEQFAKGTYSITQVRRMACANGLQCSRNNFWKLLHNPGYCGIVTVPPNKTEEIQYIKGIHEPLISEELFNVVQILLKSRRRHKGKRENMKYLFPLRGFLVCPYCASKMTGSQSQGRKLHYRYYHCNRAKCKGRFKAEIIECTYEAQLKKISLAPAVYELFERVLEDENKLSVRIGYVKDRKAILDEISQRHALISKARKLFLNEKIDFDDFVDLKKEYNESLNCLSDQLNHINKQIAINNANNVRVNKEFNILQSYQYQDIAGKRYLIDLFTPSSIVQIQNTLGPLKIHEAVSKIVKYND